MTAIDDALAAGAARPDPRDQLVAEPRRRLAVVTCMDTRLDPLRDLGLELGDAHVIRNAGGRVTDDVLRSLVLSWHALGTREVLIVHHTACGVHVDDEAALRQDLEARTGASLDDVALHTFADPDRAIADDVARVRTSPFAPEGLVVRGAVHDVDAGVVRPVEL